MKKIYLLLILLVGAGTLVFAQTKHVVTALSNPFRYSPQDLSINTGDTVEFRNSTTVTHPTIFDNGPFAGAVNALPVNGSFRLIFTQPGAFTFYCNAHATANSYPAGQTGKITVTASTGVTKNNGGIGAIQVYPNPATDKISVIFNLKKDNMVTVKLIDVLGNEVATLLNDRLSSGEYNQSLAIPSRISKGLYFVKVSIGSESSMKRISIQ